MTFFCIGLFFLLCRKIMSFIETNELSYGSCKNRHWILFFSNRSILATNVYHVRCFLSGFNVSAMATWWRMPMIPIQIKTGKKSWKNWYSDPIWSRLPIRVFFETVGINSAKDFRKKKRHRLHQNSAPAHTVTDHSSHSPDLTPCNFSPFPKGIPALRGKFRARAHRKWFLALFSTISTDYV